MEALLKIDSVHLERKFGSSRFVAMRVSSYFHSSFSTISSPCVAVINPYLT